MKNRFTKLISLSLFASLIGCLFSSSLFANSSNETKYSDVSYDDPIFMPASYSSKASDDPNYNSSQKVNMFDRMNIGSTWDNNRGENVKVAVIDTGVTKDHDDFKLGGSSMISPKSLNVLYSTPSTDLTDGRGHGTNTSSCVFSQFNGVGGVGIAPNVEFIFFKVGDDSGAMGFAAINRALAKCIEYGVDVISMSIQSYCETVSYGGQTQQGYATSNTALKDKIDACYNAGITMVAAAGNFNTTVLSYPASNDHVISVGALAATDDTKAGYSNYGHAIDVVAPGSVYVANKSGSYGSTQGTSFSCPLVAGAIALYKSKYPTATPDQIETQLKSTCDPLDDSSYPGWSGSGKVNVAKFLDNGPSTPKVDVTSVVPTETSVVMEDKSTHQLSVSVLPSNATKKGLFYSSSDTSIVSVNENGLLTSRKPGTASITVKSVDNESIYSIVNVTVNRVEVTGLTLTHYNLDIDIGQKVTNFYGIVQPENATDQDKVYSSSDSTIASVSKYGTITGVSNGTATITVKAANGLYTANCKVTVGGGSTEKYLVDKSQIEFAIDNDKLNIGDKLTEQLVSYPDDLTEEVVIESSNNAVFTIDNLDSSEKGMFMFDITARNAGVESIRVRGVKSGVTATYPIQVFASRTLSSISTTGQTTSYFVNDTFRYDGALKATFSNGDIETVVPTSVSSPNMSTSGTKTVTISYTFGGVTKTTSYTITVKAIEVLSIAVSGMKTNYFINDSFSFNGTCIATYNNSATKKVTPKTVSSPNMSTKGTKTVTVTYSEGGKTVSTSYTITVSENVYVSIEVKKAPNKSVYYEDDIFDPTGMVFSLIRSDSVKFDITYSESCGVYVPKNMIHEGINEIEFCYEATYLYGMYTINGLPKQNMQDLDIGAASFGKNIYSKDSTYIVDYKVNNQNVRIQTFGVDGRDYNAGFVEVYKGSNTYIKNLDALPGYITNIDIEYSDSGSTPTIYVSSNTVASDQSISLGTLAASKTQSVNVDHQMRIKYFYFDGSTMANNTYLVRIKFTLNYNEPTPVPPSPETSSSTSVTPPSTSVVPPTSEIPTPTSEVPSTSLTPSTSSEPGPTPTPQNDNTIIVVAIIAGIVLVAGIAVTTVIIVIKSKK